MVAASQRRKAEDGGRLDFLWQPICWNDDVATNRRIVAKIEYDGAPLWAWFKTEDLLPPPFDGDRHYRDSPLANRFAINLAVIVKESAGKGFALLHHRHWGQAASPLSLECGISESVHGNRGWEGIEECDIRAGRPDLRRTALRCLWQELGIAAHGTLRGKNSFDAKLAELKSVGTFEISIGFTALILNKQELSPRLLGYIEILGSLASVERASRKSYEFNHVDFGRRPDKDAAHWDAVRVLPATREAFASLFAWPQLITPECRARLLFYLKKEFPDTWREEPKTHVMPDWLSSLVEQIQVT